MSIEVDVLNGRTSWRLVEPLFDTVWSSEIISSAPWRHVNWANADLRVLVETPDAGLICHVGLYFRQVTWNGRKLHIGGVGGVMTHPDHRRRGYASIALDAAIRTMRDRQDVQFALLLCEPHNFAFYQARGWHPFEGEIWVEQPQGRIRFEAMSPFIFH